MASNYDTVILADSPDLFWNLDESSGTTVNDTSGNGRHGKKYNNQVVSAAACVPGWASLVEGEPGSKKSNFVLGSWSGSTQSHPGAGYRADAYEPYQPGGQVSLECILTKTEAASFATIFSADGDGAGGEPSATTSPHPTWEMGALGGKQMMRFYPNVETYPLGWVDWGTPNTDHPHSAFELNVATHIVCTYDDATGLAEWFVNGNSQGQQGPLGFFDTPLAYNTVRSPGNFQVGWRGNFTTPNPETYGGFIDKIAVYERILTREEIRAHREAFHSYAAPDETQPNLGVTGPRDGAGRSRTDAVRP